MALIVNGTEIKSTDTINYNGTSLTKIIYNGTTVWKKVSMDSMTMYMNYTLYTERTSNTFKYKGIDIEFYTGLPAKTEVYVDYSINDSSNVFRCDSMYSIDAGTTSVTLDSDRSISISSSDTVHIYLRVFTYLEDGTTVKLYEYNNGDPTSSSTYRIFTSNNGDNYPEWTGGKTGTMYY